MGLDLALLGHPPLYTGLAHVRSLLPDRDEAASTQRTRWEHGQLHTLFQKAPALFTEGLKHLRPELLALGLDLTVPPLALLASLLLGTTAAAGAGLLLGASPVPLAIALGSLAGVGLGVLGAWWGFGRTTLPARYVLINPWLDLTCSTPAYARNGKADFSLQREDLLRAAKAYLDRPAMEDKVVFPLIAPPRGFPPGLILVGGNDLLVDDSLIFASLARSCGVDVRIIVLESMPHVWPALVKQLECSRAGLAAVSRFVVAGAS